MNSATHLTCKYDGAEPIQSIIFRSRETDPVMSPGKLRMRWDWLTKVLYMAAYSTKLPTRTDITRHAKMKRKSIQIAFTYKIMLFKNRLHVIVAGILESEGHSKISYLRIITIAAILVSHSASATITEGGRGVLFGPDHAFAVTAEPDWVLDNQSGSGQGLHMVFYPKGETWSESPVFIYGRAVSTKKAPSVKDLVAHTVNDFQKNGSPNVSAEAQLPLTLPSGQKVEFYLFSGDQWGNYEAAAYFRETDTINFLVFSSRTKKAFDKYIRDFFPIVVSYQNLYTSPSTNTKARLDSLRSESSLMVTKPGGKEYESRAIKATGQATANSMGTCTSYLHNKKLAGFSYFVRIDREGGIIESNIFPTNSLSVCVKVLMSDVKYPAHRFESFVLNIEMRVTP